MKSVIGLFYLKILNKLYDLLKIIIFNKQSLALPTELSEDNLYINLSLC